MRSKRRSSSLMWAGGSRENSPYLRLLTLNIPDMRVQLASELPSSSSFFSLPESSASRCVLCLRSSRVPRSSKFENLIVLQHARPVLTGVLLDFLHSELDFAGLQMRDIDLRATFEFCELLGEHARTKVLRNDRHLPSPVAKSGLDNQIPQVGDLVDHRPKGVVGRGVAGKHQALPAGIEVIADCRHDMICR